MTQLLQSKGLWPMLDAEQPEFTRDYEQFVHRCKMDEAKGLIGLHVSDNFLFHIVECKTPKNVWDKLGELYGKPNHFRALQLQVDLQSLSLDAFPSIQDFLA